MVESKKIKELEIRISKLEKVVFETKKDSFKQKSNQYKGLVGGINLLIDNNFFDKPCLVNEVVKELKREAYHYSVKSIDKLLRDFHKKRILTRFEEDKKWKYVLRK